MKIRFHDKAEYDIDVAVGSYPLEHADRFIDEYENFLVALEQRPLSFGKLESHRGKRQLRRCIFEKFPYVLIFEVTSADEIVIIAIVHAKRRPSFWRDRLE